MKRTSSVVLLLSFLIVSCSQKAKDPVSYVNPFMGNISHLLVPTYPTVHLPNSMLRFYPGRDNFTSAQIQGFPLNIISHRSTRVFNLAPFSGDPVKAVNKLYYTYDNENITPYSYEVDLDEDGTRVRFAPSERSGFYSFLNNNQSDIGFIIRTTGNGELKFKDQAISGFDMTDGVKTWLYLEFERKPQRVRAVKAGEVSDQPVVSGSGNGLMIVLGHDHDKQAQIRYGISYISAEQAQKNLKGEIKVWDFNKVTSDGRIKWNEVLSSISVEGGTDDQKTVFYTSLYRCFERMINITEEGSYFSIWNNRVMAAEDTTFYSDDWVWDTHLALHPLQVLLNPGEQDDKITSYIRMARQSGWMPTFPVITGDHHAMNGNHSVAVILDAWNKGITNFDLEEAYEHLKNTILTETRLPWVRDSSTWLDRYYDTRGYYPALKKDEQETCLKVHSFEKRQAVAITLATCYDDWCMAQIANKLGREEDYDFFSKRSLSYKNLFKKDTGFYHPKDSSGNWIEPFDYRFDGGMGARDYYDENNGWTYIWQPYHAFGDLIDMMGGKDKFEDKLDQLFTVGLGKSKWQYYSTLPDATGNVGQFVMGNEPSMHIPYLYNLAGKPWKTQKRVRMLMETWFRNDLMGVSGDEDGGGLSAFYVFSAMGFYPLTPGIPQYQIGSPLFDRIVINLNNGRKFTIIARNNSRDNKYIQSATLNGKHLSESVLTHSDILNGGTLVFEMAKTAGTIWGEKTGPDKK